MDRKQHNAEYVSRESLGVQVQWRQIFGTLITDEW